MQILCILCTYFRWLNEKRWTKKIALRTRHSHLQKESRFSNIASMFKLRTTYVLYLEESNNL